MANGTVAGTNGNGRADGRADVGMRTMRRRQPQSRTVRRRGNRGDVIDFKHQMREQHGRGCDVREKKIEEAVVRVNGEFRPAEVTFTEAPAGPG